MDQRLRVLWSILLLGIAFACTEKQPDSPVVPRQHRLKAVEYLSTGTTQFSYDASNRINAYTGPSSLSGLVTYDDQNRYDRIEVLTDPANPGQGTRYRYSYATTTRNFSIYESGLTPSSTEFNGRHFLVDDQNRVTYFYTGDGAGSKSEKYTYTGDNLTTIVFGEGRRYTTVTYEYDDKLNPLYGNFRGTQLQQYSRNNVLKSTTTGDLGKVYVTDYVYTYNEQGLPVSVREKDGKETHRFRYEAY